MTSVLSPIPAAGSPIRDPVGAVLTTAPRAVAPVSSVETARAPRPVDGANPAEILRNRMQSERPVGPPPSFEINVLQDIRARLTDPSNRTEAPEEPDHPPADTSGLDIEAGPDVEAGTWAESEPPAEVTARPAVLGADPEPPHQLDMKV